MNIVRPVQITSPISGNPVLPRISERVYDGRIYVEATWNDPSSGTFIRKGVVKVLDSNTREDITHTLTGS